MQYRPVSLIIKYNQDVTVTEIHSVELKSEWFTTIQLIQDTKNSRNDWLYDLSISPDTSARHTEFTWVNQWQLSFLSQFKLLTQTLCQ